MNDPKHVATTPDQPDRTKEPSLTTKVVRGAGWMFAGKFAGRGLAVIKLIILARLLSPGDFGLFGIMMLATMALDTFTRTGFDKALIQFPDDTRAHLDTAWTIQILRGFILAAALYLVAPLVARFFDEPRITALLQVFCIAPLIAGFDNIGIIYLKKDLDFKKQVFFGLCSDVMAMIVGVTMAFYLRNVWALVGGTLTACITRNLLSYFLHPYRPRVAIRAESVRRLFGYGVWLLGSSILVFVSMKGDRIILGHLLGASALGVFGMAFQIADLPVSQVSELLNNVMMPAYAKAQQARERLRRAFLRVWELVASLSLPLAAFMTSAAPEIVLGVIGDEWRAAINPLRILAVAGLLRALEGTTTPLFLGTGVPRLQFLKTLTRGVVTLALVYPLTLRYGVSGTALAGLAGAAALAPFLIVGLRVTDARVAETLKALLPGVLLSVGVVAAVYLARLLPVTHPTLMLVCMIGCGALITIPMAWLIYRLYDEGPFHLLREGAVAADIRRPKWMDV